MISDVYPRDRYYCVLDEQPDHLVPAAALAPYAGLLGGDHGDGLIVNPRCWLGWHGALPAPLAQAAGSGDGLFDFPWTIWVDDTERGAVWPYWLDRRYAHLLADLVPGEPCRAELPDEVVSRLRIVGVLVTPDAAARARHAWSVTVQGAATLMERGYLPLSDLLPPFHVSALRRYYRYHTRMGTFCLGDKQSPRRYTAYDEPVTQFFHRQLTQVVSDVTRRVVVPSYSYLSFYQGGAGLEWHTDREACEYTLSLCIDATPDPQMYGAWPLHLMTSEGEVTVTQGVGDGILFCGREIPHWRDQLPEGYTSSSVLLHYVAA